MPTMNEYFIQESVECAGARCGPPYPAEPQTRSLFAWVRENMTHIRNLPVPADSFHADSVITFKDGASATVLVSWLEDFAAVAAGEKCPASYDYSDMRTWAALRIDGPSSKTYFDLLDNLQKENP